MSHEMICEKKSGPQRLLSCPACERRVVVSRNRLTVLERGDFWASHSYGVLRGAAVSTI